MWATGYRRYYPWLRLPVLDRSSEIRQRRVRTPVPGLYVLTPQSGRRKIPLLALPPLVMADGSERLDGDV